ncbi:MAG: phosphotransferase [Rhodobacteraceae bacterium]|nr:phosphotransferase [Paracoccaceae bacterium]
MTPADAAARAWGARSAPLAVAERENAVYRIELAPGPAALRLHRAGYQSAPAIRSELWWLAALAAEGLPVPAPVRRPGGALTLRLADGRLATAVAWLAGSPSGAGGVPLAGEPAAVAARHRRLGRLIGRIHAATDRLTLPRGFVRPRWDLSALLGPRPRWGRFWAAPWLDPAEARALVAARRHLRRALLAHAAAGGDFGLIHADVLRENVLRGAGGPALIDFDDAGWGFRLYDLGTVLSQDLAEPGLGDLAVALADGYAEIRPLTGAGRGGLALFTLLRCLASAGWPIGRMAADDPRARRYAERALALAEAVLGGRMRLG